MKTEDQNIEILNTELRKVEFPKDKLLEFDLGCGKGTFSTELARQYPDRIIISTDVMIGRLRKLSKRNSRIGLTNCRFLKFEVWHLLNQCIEDESVYRFHILCPDPWPKEKHKAFRLISSEFVARLALKLKKGGIFHFSTDDNPYFEHALDVLGKADFFKRDDSLISDVIGIKTDFEKKWNEMGLIVKHAAWQKI
ncbi:MAG: tRNA (guanosine(46)-N7)-methyltransferase TrmB [Lentisphaerota bacterium]